MYAKFYDSGLRRGQADIRNLTVEIENLQRGVEDVSKRATDFGESVMPHDDLASLRRRVNESGLAVLDQESDRVFVRASRVAIQGRLAQKNSRKTLPNNVGSVASLAGRGERLEADLISTNRDLTAANEAQRKGELLVSELHDRRTSVTLLTDAVVWARETSSKFVKLRHEESAMAMAVQEGVAKLDELRQLRSEATVALTHQNQSLRESTARVQASRELTSVLEDLARTEHNWREDQQQVLSTDSEIEGSLARLKSRNEEERAVSSQFERNTKQQAAIEREIARLEQNSSNLSQLLSRVEDYLDDGACPLCGHDHGSLSDLLRQIGQRRVEDRANDQRVELTRFRGVHEELDQKRRKLRRIVEDDAARVARLQSERADRVERIARFEETATRAGVTLELIHPTQIEEAVARLQATVRKETEEEARRIRFFQDQVEQTRVNMRDLERRIEEADQEVIETQNRLQKLKREIDLLLNDSRTDRVSLDADIATLE